MDEKEAGGACSDGVSFVVCSSHNLNTNAPPCATCFAPSPPPPFLAVFIDSKPHPISSEIIESLHVLPFSSLLLLLTASATPRNHHITVHSISPSGELQKIGALQGHMDWVRSFSSTSLSPSSKIVASSSADHRVRLWKVSLKAPTPPTVEKNLTVDSDGHLEGEVRTGGEGGGKGEIKRGSCRTSNLVRHM